MACRVLGNSLCSWAAGVIRMQYERAALVVCWPVVRTGSAQGIRACPTFCAQNTRSLACVKWTPGFPLVYWPTGAVSK